MPLGTYPELEARGEPPTGTLNMGGCLVTAGGLVFTGGGGRPDTKAGNAYYCFALP